MRGVVYVSGRGKRKTPPQPSSGETRGGADPILTQRRGKPGCGEIWGITDFEVSPHRDRPNLGADRPQTRFKGVRKVDFYIFVKEGKKWGLRTEIEVCPPRVWVGSASRLG